LIDHVRLLTQNLIRHKVNVAAVVYENGAWPYLSQHDKLDILRLYQLCAVRNFHRSGRVSGVCTAQHKRESLIAWCHYAWWYIATVVCRRRFWCRWNAHDVVGASVSASSLPPLSSVWRSASMCAPMECHC